MVDAEREGKVTPRHYQETSKPGGAELFYSGTDKCMFP
jgi:hypothetical protein